MSKFLNEQRYWEQLFQPEDQQTSLPSPFMNHPNLYTSSINHSESQYLCITKPLPTEVAQRILEIANRAPLAIYLTLLTGVEVLLQKYTGEEELILGIPSFSLDDTTCLNELIFMKNKISKNDTCKSLFNATRNALSDALEHQNLPFPKMVGHLNMQYDSNHVPLINTVVSLNEIQPFTWSSSSQFDTLFQFQLQLEQEQIDVQLFYNQQKYNSAYVEQVLQHLFGIFEKILFQTDIEIQHVDMLSSSEKERLLLDFNRTTTNYPEEKTIHLLFEEQVLRTPDKIAVSFEDKVLTYDELNRRANRLARKLREHGVQHEQLVAILAERSVEMVVSILAILKAGAAYVPIDPHYPDERIHHLIEDCGAKVLVTQGELQKTIPFKGTCLLLDEGLCDETDDSNLDIHVLPTHLAYVIYTSGTTGKPKGTMIEHRNVVRLFFNSEPLFDFNETDVWTLFHSYCFDFSVWEMYGALLYGGKLVIVPALTAQNPELFMDVLLTEQVTILNQTPTYFYQLMQVDIQERTDKDDESKPLHLRTIIFGGEALNPALLQRWKSQHPTIQLVNMYGITETTVHVTYKELSEADMRQSVSNIGGPIPTLQVYVLNEALQLQPVGAFGELFVAGAGLARGYLNKAELTAERFLDNPFVPGEKMYRTGDLARWLPDGNLEYRGRIDQQVKIRGYRIELGEVEAAIQQVKFVKDTVVIAYTDAEGETTLCAYYAASKQLSVNKVKEALSKKLPSFMLPSYWIQVEAIPITANGKLDRKALPAPFEAVTAGKEYAAPRTELEQCIADIWEQVLKINEISIHDNFFDIGGHSLRAAAVVSLVHKQLNVYVTIRDVFDYPTIEQLAGSISNVRNQKQPQPYTRIPVVPQGVRIPVSSTQKSLYILNQLKGGELSYNMPTLLLLEGQLDVKRLEQAFQQIVQRHDSLRTSFEEIDGVLVQRIEPQVNIQIQTIKTKEEDVYEQVLQFVQPFQLSEAPLIRVGLLAFEEARDHSRHLLMMDMHHIISDGESFNILIQELMQIYEGKQLEPLQIQYKDYAAWLDTEMESARMGDQETYWLTVFQDQVPILNLPTDYARPAAQQFTGQTYEFSLDEIRSTALKQLAQQHGATLYMMLLSIYTTLLSKYSGQSDIVVGSPISSRSHLDVEPLIGMFVNTLAIRNYPEGHKTFAEYVQEVKENVLKAFDCHEYPFEKLVDRLSVPRDMSRNPLFDTMFVLQNAEQGTYSVEGLTISQYPFETSSAKFDLTFSAIETGERVAFGIQYATSLYHHDTIERMARHFMQLIDAVITSPSAKLSAISLVTPQEKIEILQQFNDTTTDYPREKTIHQLFEEQVEQTPDQIAIVCEDIQWTYKELNARANQLARSLRSLGVQKDHVVSILVDRSPEMIIGILAVLKAGGAYMPIDPEYPNERIMYMIEDSASKVMLTQLHLRSKVTFSGSKIMVDDEEFYYEDSSNLTEINSSTDLSYIIYTSGTSGKPKGNLTTHRNIVRVVKHTNYIDLSVQDRVLQLSSYCFDGSTFDIFGSLLNGATLVLIRKDTLLDIEKLAHVIECKRISAMFITTAYLNLLVETRPDCLKQLRVILFGGERASVRHVRTALQYMGPGKLKHVYGPTESTVFATCYDVHEVKDDAVSVPIGIPISNTSIYIVNEENELQPVGIMGELCIAGDGLARGYLNCPDLNAAKFVDNPFVPGERMYRTGDFARWMPDGTIDYIGRIDDQVKIRGFRIELGEIESQLLKIDSIRAAVVVLREGEMELCAYYVADHAIQSTELREALSDSLPSYMMPSTYMQMEKLPITSNGKLDRKALPAPDAALLTGRAFAAPRNLIESQLCAVWKEVLGMDKISVKDSFFELGGHSLRAVLLVNKLYKQMNVRLQIRDVFRLTTIEKMAQQIADMKEESYLAIAPAEVKEYYPASSVQKRLYILQQVEDASLIYNMPSALLMEGSLDKARMEEAFGKLIARHESLRTSFDMINGEIVQRIHRDVDFSMEFYTCNEEVASSIIQKFTRVFDLKRAPLLRVGLIEVTEKRHILLYDMHHMISDGLSMGVLMKEFSSLYNGEDLPNLPIQYKDYSVWQKSLTQKKRYEDQEAYWLNALSGELPILEMPLDYTRPLRQTYEGAVCKFIIDAQQRVELQRIADEHGATLYMVLLALYTVLLHKYTGQEDIVVGTVAAGRSHDDLQQLIGMFVNTLAIRNYPCADKAFLSYLQEVQDTMMGAFDHQDYPFEELVEKLQLVRDMSRNPLFDTMFVLQNAEQESVSIEGLQVHPLVLEQTTSKFDLTLNVIENDGMLVCSFEYATALYMRDTIARMASHFKQLVDEVIRNPLAQLGMLDIVTAEEKVKMIKQFNDTAADYPREKTIHQLFEEQAAQYPDATAVIFEQEELTYRQLNERSNQLARTLRKHGVQPDQPVGIMAERSADMVVGIIAILKAGGAYVPIDPDYPMERVQFMLGNSGANVLLIQQALAEKVAFDGTVITLDEEQSYDTDCSNIEIVNTPTDLAYIIYTSGTTGKPKGTLIEHRHVVRLLFNDKNLFDFGPFDTWTLFHSFCFDFSVWEMYGALLYGGKLIIVPPLTAKSPQQMLQLLVEQQVTILNQTPSYFYQLAREAVLDDRKDLSIRKVIFGGESLNPSLLKDWKSCYHDTQLINMYGITETTVFVTYKEITDLEIEQAKSNIGFPIPTLRVYILDANRQCVPIGVNGEIYVAGDGLARGYLHRPELTAERFVDNPFEPGERMYKSGDLARWLPDGNIEYIGRIDHQVKIRGHRIELEEIENSILLHEGIQEAVTIVRNDEPNSQALCVYYVANRSIEAGEIRNGLQKILPDYMIPSYFIPLEHFPLTLNGKLDRKALPAPEKYANLDREYVGPRTELERRLAVIWTKVLKRDTVSVHSNFFTIGGHSLRAAALSASIYAEMKIQLSLRDVFECCTIEQMAMLIEDRQQRSDSPITVLYEPIMSVGEQDYYPVSSAQQRMYILHQLEGEQLTYNVPSALRIEGKVDAARLEQVFYQLIQRHESLRTSFHMFDGEPVQQIHDDVSFAVKTMTVTAEQVTNTMRDLIQPFQLEQAPLIRVALLELEASESNEHSTDIDTQGTEHTIYMLLIDMHHIISDGMSLHNLMKEWLQLHSGEELSPLHVQYKDFAVWNHNHLMSEQMNKHEAFWQGVFEGELPILNLATDYDRPLVRDYEGSTFEFTIPKELSSKLYQLADETGSTMYMLLLSIYSALLSIHSGQDDIIVGSPIAGRPLKELEPIIGMFVNTVALRTYPLGEKSFAAYLQEVKEHAIQAFEHQDYPFEMLVERTSNTRDMSRHPVFDTMFALQNNEPLEVNMGDMQVTGISIERANAKFDISLYAAERDDLIHCSFEYATSLFKPVSIERLANHMLQLMEQLVANPQMAIASLNPMTPSEQDQLLQFTAGSQTSFPHDTLIHQLYEQQVNRTPEHIALISEGQTLSYQQLNARANQLARTLRASGVKPDERVVIIAERTPEMIIGIFAILKAGGAYVPIDPSYPLERIEYMIKDCGAKVLLQQQKGSQSTIPFEGTVIDLDDPLSYQLLDTNLEPIQQPNHLAYVIYTSGSTGKPKGVMVENRSVVNRLTWMQDAYPIDAADAILHKTPITFDVSVWELFWWSIVGARLVLLPSGDEKNPERIYQTILEHNITTMHFVPAMLHAYLTYVEHCDDSTDWTKQLKYVFASGEALQPSLVTRFYTLAGSTRLVNLYGPTEATVDVTHYLCEQGKAYNHVPIGRPISNTQIYIMRQGTEQLAPVHITGELCIVGEGLARGYLNQPELTARQFVVNPFVSGQKMYKTGDLARWLPDGNIEYLGRVDDQVKIRGVRIELGEIEASMLEHPSIQQAVALARKDHDGSQILCTYFVAAEELMNRDVREFLVSRLPEAMIPSYFVQLEEIPVMQNGKTDRKSLPAPESSVLHTVNANTAPRNDFEVQLLNIWKEVLGPTSLSITDNFFEVGGHSLRATTLITKIRSQLDMDVTLRDVFRYPTIEQFTQHMSGSKPYRLQSIPIAEEQDCYPVSSAQKRLYLLHQLEGGERSYNMPQALRLDGTLDVTRLNEALVQMMERHESLRTSFELREGELVQRIVSHVDYEIKLVHLEESEVEGYIRRFGCPFDLSQAPLLRVELVRILSHSCELDQHVLLLDTHHIITDGVSQNIFMKEWFELYEGQQLSPIGVQYKDYSVWQQSELQSRSMKNQEAYWLSVFEGTIPILDMPTDYTRPAVQHFEGDTIGFVINQQQYAALQKLAAQNGSTMYMLLLALYTTLLAKYSGQEDIIVGSPIAGRVHNDLEPLIGMFVNTLAIRNFPEANKTFQAYLQEVKERLLQAYEHQGFPFEELVDKVKLQRDQSRNPLFDTMLVLQNMESYLPKLQGLRVTPHQVEHTVSKLDFILWSVEQEGQINCTLEFAASLFKKETMHRMSQHFIRLIQSVIDNPNARLSELQWIEEAEKVQIMEVFNDTKMELPRAKTVHQMFEEQAERTPEHIAVVCGDKQLTYRELNTRANSLARALKAQGIQAEQLIGIMTDRSIEMIVGLLGILKAGGAYVPIDPQYPEERIQYMLSDSNIKILLLPRHLQSHIHFKGISIFVDDLAVMDSLEDCQSNLSCTSKPEQLMYVIYTSGSTGKPKGVMVEHQSVSHLIRAMKHSIPLDEHQSMLSIASFAFDMFVFEAYFTLTNGMKLILADQKALTDGEEFARLISRLTVDCMQCTPSALRVLMNQPESRSAIKHLKIVMIGGEAFPAALLDQLKTETNALIFNMYGPTETTVWTTSAQLEESGIHIGKPIANTQIFIVNSNLQLMPVGLVGELCISGYGLARGYLNREDLTNDKFVDHPFIPGTKIYRTGDLARWLPDGNIEYIGRMDHQVKIRGYRIELGEVENQLLQIDDMKEAVVVANADKEGVQQLCAYIVADRVLAFDALRAALLRFLPDYMIPSHFIQLDHMPLTHNGKVNIHALPEPESNIGSRSESIPPVTLLELQLLQIWQEVLGNISIGIKDNFFEVGGHSLKVLQLIHKISSLLHVQIPYRAIFEAPTIEHLAQLLPSFFSSGAEKQAFVPLNQCGSLPIFCFPPLMGFGMVYAEFAQKMDGKYTFYAIDFIEKNEEELLDEFVQSILDIQHEGPFRLLGYSAGGNLAYEVGKHMEKQGYTVSDLILLDAKWNDPLKSTQPEFLMEQLHELYDQIPEHVKPQLNLAFMQEKTMAYMMYYNQLIHTGKVQANIHHVIAEGSERGDWPIAAHCNYKMYDGRGKHYQLLQTPFLDHNAEMVLNVLDESTSKPNLTLEKTIST